jgi:murein DD-endopeptidase MepM/ murein hydrolase activator NlpD
MTCMAALSLALAPAAHAQSGGTGAPGPPQVRSVSCSGAVAGCGARRGVVRGQEFIVRGTDLGLVRGFTFTGSRSKRDDARGRFVRRGSRYLVGVVPRRARGGALVLLGVRRSRLAKIARVRVRRALPPQDISPKTTFFYAGKRKATFTFSGTRAATVQVELVNESTQAVVRAWSVGVQPGLEAHVTWDGRGAGGKVEPPGRYRFRLAATAGAATSPAPGSATNFFFADHLFPIRGRHDLGQTPTNNFGGGGTRRHFGQDMFARCGTKLAAVRGGTVQYAGYHSAAGNYIVIDGAGTGTDYVYMHLRRPALVSTGDRVFTGQRIGEVGETGRASGCHLHFEMWTGPGWYEGGSAFDPLPALRAWDSYS